MSRILLDANTYNAVKNFGKRPEPEDTRWTKTDENRYAAEASDFTAEVPTCPVCSEPLHVAAMKHHDGEGELTHWTLMHCGATLTIFND